MASKIKILKFKPLESNTLRGFADIAIVAWTLRINGVGIHEKVDGDKVKRWVSLPSKDYKTQDGKKKYVPVMEFADKDIYFRFANSVLTAFDEYNANE